MKKVVSTIIYLVIILAFYGGLKILMPGNVPDPVNLFPSEEGLAAEDYYLVVNRGPLWPLKGPKIETPPLLSHLAPSYPTFTNKHYWLDLPVKRTSPKVFINHEYPQPIEILDYVEKLPANFTKSGEGLISYPLSNTQLINEKPLVSHFGYAGVNKHKNHSATVIKENREEEANQQEIISI